MKVRFLKYCPWSYRLTNGILTRHGEDSTAIVPDIEGREMVRSGYARQVNSARPTEAKVVEPKEAKIVKAEEPKATAKKKQTKKARKKAGSK